MYLSSTNWSNSLSDYIKHARLGGLGIQNCRWECNVSSVAITHSSSRNHQKLYDKTREFPAIPRAMLLPSLEQWWVNTIVRGVAAKDQLLESP